MKNSTKTQQTQQRYYVGDILVDETNTWYYRVWDTLENKGGEELFLFHSQAQLLVDQMNHVREVCYTLEDNKFFYQIFNKQAKRWEGPQFETEHQAKKHLKQFYQGGDM